MMLLINGVNILPIFEITFAFINCASSHSAILELCCYLASTIFINTISNMTTNTPLLIRPHIRIIMNYFSDITSILAETQFSAMTVFLEEGPTVIIYRGTDETMIGWKEDFNMCFKEPVTGQSLSALYLQQVSQLIDGKYMVTGHSKGGNLAQYVTVRRPRAVQRCVSFDGQGFADEFMNTYRKNVHNVRQKIRSVCAYNDYVNILLQPIASEIVYLFNEKKIFKAHYIYELYKHPYNRLDDKGCYKKVRRQCWGTWLLKQIARAATCWINTWWPLAEFWAYTIAGRILAWFMATDGDERAEIQLEFARNVKDFVKQEFFQIDHYDPKNSNKENHCATHEHDHQKH